ncbi:hypothetical protein [Sporosarcina sp. P3]|nr:hypothetical protein [Sporosarcina sp. P3]
MVKFVELFDILLILADGVYERLGGVNERMLVCIERINGLIERLIR